MVSALAAPVVQRGLLLRGTPIGGENTLVNDVTANFFLSERVLGNQVHARIGGHRAKVVHVGGNDNFYVAKLPITVHLHYSHLYRVIIVACDNAHHCASYNKVVKLPKPSL